MGACREGLLALCQRHGAHLSRNARRRPAPGVEERFVTARGYGVGSARWRVACAALLDDLRALGEVVLECESEYCVFDDNLGRSGLA